jgi:RNA polymerase sigma factor (sigma-70 family)
VERTARDARLVVQAQLGDRRALAELVERWHDPVWRYVRRMLDASGPADDVSQEVWAAALKALPRLRQPERFAPWLFTIARRSVMNQLRVRYATAGPAGAGPDDDDLAASEGDGGPMTGRADTDEADTVLDREQLSSGLVELPVAEREVLILFYLHDLPLEDCAQILQIPVGTVKSRLFRARRLLRDRLIEKGYSS